MSEELNWRIKLDSINQRVRNLSERKGESGISPGTKLVLEVERINLLRELSELKDSICSSKKFSGN